MSAPIDLGACPPIEDLVPHQPPVRALDAITAFTPGGALAARARLYPNGPFDSPGGALSTIGLELLGQAAAAYFSLSAWLDTRETDAPAPPTPGMLIASRRYTSVAGHFPRQCVLGVTVSPTSAMAPNGLVKFSGTISVSEKDAATNGLPDAPFATGDLSVYLPRA